VLGGEAAQTLQKVLNPWHTLTIIFMILIKTNPVKNTLMLDKGYQQDYNFPAFQIISKANDYQTIEGSTNRRSL